MEGEKAIKKGEVQLLIIDEYCNVSLKTNFVSTDTM